MKNDRSHTGVSQLFDFRLANNHLGFTLFELLISIAILAMIMIGLQQVIGVCLSAYKSSRDSGYLLSRARFAMERMVMFASETDYIFFPTSSSPMTQLQISERLLDTYDNATLIYTADGDGYLDADIDSDGTVNEESGPPPENEVKFSLDTTDPNNWKLTEKLPDYSTSNLSDSLSSRVICEHVTAFNCRLLSANLVEIALNLQDDNGSVSLKTRVIAGNLYLDVTPPIPNPMTWAGSPAAPGPNSITMTATTASDESGVEYYFECTAGGGHDSNWQDSPAYEDTGLVAEILYTYRVKARDKSPSQNETDWSSDKSATPNYNIYVNDITMSYRVSGQNYYGQATVWIKNEIGTSIEGATVYGEWSGDVSGADNGATAADGKVMIESPEKKFGGTFIFTVTDVVKSGYPYNPALNVETSDSITAP